MATFDKLVRASTLEEAYELNLHRTNVILGGFMWLRQSNRHFQTAIDLSGLNLNRIEETDEAFCIGCMCTLRELECHEGLNLEFSGGLQKALGHIVGVQFRNGATVGGSIYGRFGFSDVLTCLLALDAEVQLYKGGLMPLRKFVEAKADNDILTSIRIKKNHRRLVYHSHRLSKTDFPVIAVGVSRNEGNCLIAVGARPEKAGLLEKNDLFGAHLSADEIAAFGNWAAAQFTYGTNIRGSADYREHLAAQGTFALESAVDELAAEMKVDPVWLRQINRVTEGDTMPAYFGETLNSCALGTCLEEAKRLMDWDKKYPRMQTEVNKVRSVGVAMSMQGSGIPGVDTATAIIKFSQDGLYTLSIGAADMGTGCDTILAQMAADVLKCSPERIQVPEVDTDISPYDTGSYASSTTYVTGMAVVKACEELVASMKAKGAEKMGWTGEDTGFDGTGVFSLSTDNRITLESLCEKDSGIQATAAFQSPVSPPPFIVGMAEIEIDLETGELELLDYVAVVDCGTVINPILARVQVEGGVVQGIGMALYEDVVYSQTGQNYHNSLMQYKIPTRLDIKTVRVAFESSHEPTGPFGAKSIGELVINTPAPAIANAVFNAVGVRIRELPITAEKIFYGMSEKPD